MASKDKLKELLHYSTSLSQQDGVSPASSTNAAKSKLDASMLDAIMGPDDAKLMLSSMSAIEDPALPLDHIEVAFENLEALVEQIDNAKNLKNMNLWTPLLSQLAKSQTMYRKGACSVIATAVQNNPDSQAEFLRLDGLARVLELFKSDSDLGVRRKALFAITSTVRNNAQGQAALERLQGWKVMSEYLDDATPDPQMLKRIIFFLRTIYDREEVQTGITTVGHSIDQTGRNVTSEVSSEARTGFPPKLLRLLGQEYVQDDEDLAEKTLQTLIASLDFDAEVLNRQLKVKLKALAQKMEERYGPDMCDYDLLYSLL